MISRKGAKAQSVSHGGFFASSAPLREAQSSGATIRAPVLPSVLANDTDFRTDGKAGAQMTETEKNRDRKMSAELIFLSPFFCLEPQMR